MLTSSALLILATSHLAWAAPHCLLVDRSVDPSASRPGASGSASTAGNKSNGTFIGAAWYAGWHSSDFTLSNVSWSKYSSVIYSFAVTTSDTNFISLESSDQELLPQFVETAHQNDVNAILSIGGWTGSQFFSSSVATAENRTAFAQAVMATVKQYSLDGVEFDWEYPGKQGLGCNVISSNDSANFLAFLQELRTQDGAAAGQLLVSAAVAVTPFAGPDGEPMSDVSAFAAVLDTIEVMNYDVWGSWSPTVGPNAPLNDTCAPFADGSAVSAVKAWTDAGFAASQIILGVASYGHSFHVDKSAALASPISGTNSTLALFSPFDASLQPEGDKWDQTAGGVDECGNPNVVGGVFDFWGLIDGGFLNTDGTVSEGIDYTFDNCSQTPFVYNATSEVMVSFDNADSFFEKGQFIADMGLAGFAMWEAGGDSNDILLDAIEQGMGVDIELCGN